MPPLSAARPILGCFPSLSPALAGSVRPISSLSISRLLLGSPVNQAGDKPAFQEGGGLALAFCGKSSKGAVSAPNKARRHGRLMLFIAPGLAFPTEDVVPRLAGSSRGPHPARGRSSTNRGWFGCPPEQGDRGAWARAQEQGHGAAWVGI